ncbi:MAG: hypothetical protein Q9173_003439 [Seirophora scorigena]
MLAFVSKIAELPLIKSRRSFGTGGDIGFDWTEGTLLESEFMIPKWLATGLERRLGCVVGGEADSGVLKEKGRVMEAAKALARFEPDRWRGLSCSGDVDIGACEIMRSCFPLFILKDVGGVRLAENGVKGLLVDTATEEAAERGSLLALGISKAKAGCVIQGRSMLAATSAEGK